MAILKLGELVAGIRGTIGGTIYSVNKSGPFARGWAKGSNPRTPAQTSQRAITSTHPTEWRDLTQSKRDGWDAYAADAAQELFNSLGESYYATGFNWFSRINTHLILSGLARRNGAPTDPTPAMPTLGTSHCFEPISTDFHNRITYAFPQFLDNYVIVAVAFYPRITLAWKTRGFRFVHYGLRSTSTYTEFGLTSLALLGQPPAGGKCFFSVQNQNDQGRRSAVVTSTADVISL